ncbi:phytanoyl-CoA dioxygenase [Hyalangium sp.]|uniref:phytanoyl-CoA dioxygenase n=1 Tax=Hyalangium sp. TaxID=2028555 RepID=UPI002D2FBFD5|nr:phytanoyl-CoA dioxygenase [Hyalangium sp.]HYH96407.1 phytanoyl-CoA dioxygenase [Hyalangium sp.]
MPNPGEPVRALSDAQLEAFIQDGFVKIEKAFPRALAEEGRSILWRDTGCDPGDPATWTRPVIRLGFYGQEPFAKAASSPTLHRAFDQLVGPGRWLPRPNLGTFPVRFPSSKDPGDDGWHIDPSFGTEDPDFMAWRASVVSKGRALLMLFLFSDVGEEDAPTRLRVGSHLDIARRLAPAGEEGLSLRELAANGFAETARLPQALATGEAGTVYLCHPFLVHAAQVHRGAEPRFMAQPPLLPSQPLVLERRDGSAHSPVEHAIRNALRNASSMLPVETSPGSR